MALQEGHQPHSLPEGCCEQTLRQHTSHCSTSESAFISFLSRVEFVKLATTYSKVNLGQGFPDFPAPDFLTEALGRALSGGNHMLHQYTRAFVRGQISLPSTALSLPIGPGCFRAQQAAINGTKHEAKHTSSLNPCPLFPVTICFSGMFEAAGLEDLTELLASQSPSKGSSLV